MAKKGAKAGRVGSDVKGAFGGAVFLAAAAAVIDEAALGWAVAPFVLGLIIFAAARAPLRYSLAALASFAFVIDYPNEQLAFGLVKSPFYNVGFAMMAHLNNLTDIRALSFSGSDIVIGVLILVALGRENSGSKIDRAERLPTPKPLVRLAKISLMGTAFVFVFGQVTGGDFGKSLWQAERVVYLPTLFLLYHLALRGPKDYLMLAKVILSAATIRAVMAIYINATVIPPVDPSTGLAVLAYATSHSDSMLFAFAFVLLVLLIYERVGPKATKIALVLLPILMLGMIANNRRLVWVHVALILLTLYLATSDNPIKRRIRRTVYMASPVLAIYAAAGWNSQFGGFFKPVRIMRSVVEPTTDGSSLWRELENYNLIYTIKSSPLLGLGYGHRWFEILQLPAVSYDLEYYLPHNSLLGLWASAGLLGYTAMTLLWGAGVYFAMRAYHAATVPTDRVAAILCVGAVMVYMVQCFGDLGLGSWTGVHILAPSLAMAGKLAVTTGEWREPSGKA